MPDTPALQSLQTTVQELSKTVSGLAANVQTQTATLDGFRELFELHLKNIDRDTHAIKNALKVQDAGIDRLKNDIVEKLKGEVSELRHNYKAMQTYPKTLVSVVRRVQDLENYNLKVKNQALGATWAVRTIWAIAIVVIPTITGFLGWYAALHTK